MQQLYTKNTSKPHIYRAYLGYLNKIALIEIQIQSGAIRLTVEVKFLQLHEQHRKPLHPPISEIGSSPVSKNGLLQTPNF